MSGVFIETIGCPKNHEDSERLAGALAAAGHEIVFSPEAADVIVVNTCGFIEAAKRESIDTIFEYAPYKEEGKALVITGCLTQRYKDELTAELPEADAILGVNDYSAAPEIITALTAEKSGAARAEFVSRDTAELPRFALTSRASSYLKIAEGCDNHCAYCVIPSIRGAYRSVPIERVLREAETLASEGCKELILIAQDVTYYGKDLYGRFALPELLRKICASNAAKTIEWIRLLYCYEERVTDELIEVMADEPRILPYIDLPLQHINADILRRMNRKSTPDSIRSALARLRSAMPNIVIRTTFITGLPGETDAAFEELCGFLGEARFDRLGAFSYSPEEGTAAAEMPDQIDAETAEARREILMQIQREISLENNEKLIGTVQDAFVDAKEDTAFTGRTRGDAPEIDNAVLFSAGADDDIIGRIVRVRVTDALDYDLIGEMIS